MFRTLIVEDNLTYRQTLRENLLAYFPSMVVEEAADAEEALDRVEQFSPHLIFVDIHLPGENGLKLTERIKRKHPEMTVVILTSYDFPEYREAALKYGATSFITKDVLNVEEIKALIESVEKGISAS